MGPQSCRPSGERCSITTTAPGRVLAVSALPLDFFGRLRLLGTVHIPATLHGAGASVVHQDGLRKLRTAFVRPVWSAGLHLANPGAVLNLLEGPVGCDPGVARGVVQVSDARHMAKNWEVRDFACALCRDLCCMGDRIEQGHTDRLGLIWSVLREFTKTLFGRMTHSCDLFL